jgi:hypothetical protein
MGKGAWKRGDFAGSAQRWQTGYQNAGQNLTKGVQNPKRDPTQAAIANVNSLISGFNAATAGGAQSQWAQALAKAGLGGWQAGMTQFAQTGLAAKAQKGAPHFQSFAQGYGPAVVQQAASLPPRADFATNQQRSAVMQQWEHNQRGKYRKMWRGGA